MNLDTKTPSDTDAAASVRVLSDAEIEAVAGGLNPQPLPPSPPRPEDRR